MTDKIYCDEIEIAVARFFNSRVCTIVPNVSWGLGLNYEADMVVLMSSGYAYEVEIKTSKSDIKADLKKCHGHNSRLFRRLYFAVPDYLANDGNIPQKAGIISVYRDDFGGNQCKIIRQPTINKIAIKFSPEKREKLLHLGCMRIWSLKEARRRDVYDRYGYKEI